MKILIDSIDKRMTVRLIEYLLREGYEVDGICFKGDSPLNLKGLSQIHHIDRVNIEEDLSRVLDQYDKSDLLLIGNPKIIDSVEKIQPNIKVLHPLKESIDKANDKTFLCKLAKSIGLKVPESLESSSFPMIVKLNISENTKLKPAQRYRIIKNEADYNNSKKFLDENQGNLIKQEYVDGDSYGVSMLLDNSSNLVDYIVHQRILEYPISGGPSSLCKSTYDKNLVDSAYRILKELKWTGIAMVEFKGDHLIEINPRFWGSMPLIFLSDSDFFGNYIKILNGKSLAISVEDINYRQNKYMSYVPQALISILKLLKNKQVGRSVRGMKCFLLSREGTLMLSNPAPFFRYLKGLFGRSN